MWTAFFLENLRFGINLFSALTFFGASWLYFDAWGQSKETKEKIRSIGFLVVAISFIAAATQVESNLVRTTFLTQLQAAVNYIFFAARITGFALILKSLLIDPLQAKPDLSKFAAIAIPQFFLGGFNFLATIITPFLPGAIFFLYYRKATVGYERHLKPIALAFLLLAISEFISIGFLFRGTNNVDLYNLVAPYGVLWLIKYAVLALSTFILGRWIFVYLLKRFFTQMFMIFTTSILVIFLVTTMSFTALLLRNLQSEAFGRLATDVRVLGYAIDTKKSQVLSDAQLIAGSSQILSNLDSRQELNEALEGFLLSKDQSLLLVADKKGIVLARGEDSEKYGDILSGDPMIDAAIKGEESTSIVSKEFFPGPQISIRAAVPIKKSGNVVGVLMAGTTIDNAFVDGLKSTTNLESSAYGGNVLSATTLVGSDGKSRPIGLKEENEAIKNTVLNNGNPYVGGSLIFNAPYFAGYLPLKDVTEKTVGMIFVGEPQIEILKTASESIQATFLVSAILLLVSIIPSYFISKFITEQVA